MFVFSQLSCHVSETEINKLRLGYMKRDLAIYGYRSTVSVYKCIQVPKTAKLETNTMHRSQNGLSQRRRQEGRGPLMISDDMSEFNYEGVVVTISVHTPENWTTPDTLSNPTKISYQSRSERYKPWT